MYIFQIVTVVLGLASLGVGLAVVYMVKEFSTSMKQVTVDQGVLKALSEAAVLAQTVAEDLRSNLAIQREEFQRVVILLDRMDTKITVGGETGLRNEEESKRVAGNLTTAQSEVDRVAGSLVEAQAEVDRVAGRLKEAQSEVDRVADDLDTERVTPRPSKRAPRKRT